VAIAEDKRYLAQDSAAVGPREYSLRIVRVPDDATDSTLWCGRRWWPYKIDEQSNFVCLFAGFNRDSHVRCQSLGITSWAEQFRLGVADQVKAKSQVVAAGTNVSTLAKDTSPGIVIALSVLPEIAGHPDAKLVGPLPKELQAPVTVFAALGARPQEEAAAQAFPQELASTEAKKAYVAIGFEAE
jgi:hypothetical protein